MRGLLIVPSRADGVTFAEDIAAITEFGEFRVLPNGVGVRQLYERCRREQFDVLHFVTDTQPALDEGGRFKRVIMLHSDELTCEDLVKLSSLAGNAGLILNVCASSGIAIEATRGGVPWALFTAYDVDVRDAWKEPQLFLGAWQRMEQEALPVDLGVAYLATSNDGRYGYLENPELRKLNALNAMSNHLAKLTVDLEDIQTEAKRAAQERTQMAATVLTNAETLQDLEKRVRPRDLRKVTVAGVVFFTIQMFNTIVNLLQIHDISELRRLVIEHMQSMGFPPP